MTVRNAQPRPHGRRPAGRRRAGGRLSEGARGSPDAAREAALDLLERRRRTRSDLASRLRRRGFDAGAIAGALDRLAAVGLVDDRAYAEAFLRERLRLRPRSVRVVRGELRARGVEPAVIEAVLESFAEELDEARLARQLLERRCGRWRGLAPEVRRRRATDLLRRNGFGWDAIQEAFEAVIPDDMAEPPGSASSPAEDGLAG